MARPSNRLMAAKQPGIRNSGFWLLVAFAATVFWTGDPADHWRVVEAMTDAWWIPVGAFFAWSFAGGILGGLMKAVAGGTLPGWIFRVNGWLPATLAGGVLGALVYLDVPRPAAASEALVHLLIAMALLGAGWVILVDLPRLALWRLSRRPAPSFLAIATLAVLGGLGVLALVVMRQVDGRLTQPVDTAGLTGLGAVLACAVALTLLVQLPLAVLQRGARGADHGVTASGALTTARANLVGRLKTRSPAATGGGTVAGRTAARADHGTTATTPTVVRRR